MSIFTKIITGEIPSYKVAENDDFIAFLDINPNAKGHTLVVPKKEENKIFDLSKDEYKDLMDFSYRVAKALEKTMACKRIGMSVIGLEVPHVHVHLIPINEINTPSGATHISLRGAWAKVDFATGEADIQETNTVNLPIDAASTNVVLTPNAAASGLGTDLFLLMIEFFQEVNGNQYTLKNGAYNALSVVEVQ